jgi:metal-responsive CopG/Arc/MetJ family transcriptional regulator
MARTVTTRLEEEALMKIDELAARQGVDRSALLRSFLLYALKENTIRDALESYQAGKITLWQAAQACNLSLWEMIQEAKQRHIHASCLYRFESVQVHILSVLSRVKYPSVHGQIDAVGEGLHRGHGKADVELRIA